MSKTVIHPGAQVHPKAELADGVEVGPFAIVGERVKLGPGTHVGHHATVWGPATLGARNRIYPYAFLGGDPQDLTFKGEPTTLTIGDDNVFREYVTVNRGTMKGGGDTRLGSKNLIMAYCHIAHDCTLEDGVIMANGVQVGGHVLVESHVTFGGLAAVHHFVTVGRQSFVGGLTRVVHDVPPFMTVEGNPAKIRCVNTVGLKRRGVSATHIQTLKEAYKLLYRSGRLRKESLEILEARWGDVNEVMALVRYLRAGEASKQGRIREALRTW